MTPEEARELDLACMEHGELRALVHRLEASLRAARARLHRAREGFAGAHVRHDVRCGPKNVNMCQANPDDPRCDCGLRDAVEALGEGEDE